MVDASTLSHGLRIPLERADLWAPLLSDAMTAFEIEGPRREAAFLAQCAHESAFLTRWVENLNYTSAKRLIDVYGSIRFAGPRLKGESQDGYADRALAAAAQFVRNPSGLAECVYGMREDLGNTEPGDGAAFIGRGLLQITGRRNYERLSLGMDRDYIHHPEQLLEPEHAAMASAWFWADQSFRCVTLNELADDQMIDAISGIINRGNPSKVAVGADERRRIYYDLLDVMQA